MIDVKIGKDFMKKFCKSLREHKMQILNFLKKYNEIINKRAAGIIWKYKNLLYLLKEIEINYVKDKKYHKVWDHCHYKEEYRGAPNSICNL